MSENKLMPMVENYNIGEEFIYNKTYLFIKGFATARNMALTLKALPLCKKIHQNQYRKGTQEVKVIIHPVGEDGSVSCETKTIKVRLPYVLHVLKVASTLISLSLPLDYEELDLLIAAALLHDSIEDHDGFFKNNGYELVTEYGFPEELYTIVKLLSKRHGATQEELVDYFNEIKKNKFTLLIKMADRSHNVEDLYNMRLEKLHKYVAETRDFIYPLSAYAKANYPELSNGVTILKSKIVSLTELTETLVDLYQEKLDEKDREIAELKRQLEEQGNKK